jgi:hypothetical protein
VKQKDQKELAKNALREWVSAGTSDPSEGKARDDTEESREPPPPSPAPGNGKSPRSAAVATVKEWFSSETEEIADPVESRRQTTGHHRQIGQHSRDKIESYRQPQHGSAIRNSIPKQSNEQAQAQAHRSRQHQHQPTKSSSTDEKNYNSLLNQSKSAPRSKSNAVLARRDMAARQSPSGEYNSNSSSHSSSFVRTKTPLPERSATDEFKEGPETARFKMPHHVERILDKIENR